MRACRSAGCRRLSFVVPKDSTALLVGARDPRAMGDAVLALSKTKLRRCALRSRAKAEQRYGWRRSGDAGSRCKLVFSAVFRSALPAENK